MKRPNLIDQPICFSNCIGNEGILRELLQQALTIEVPQDQQLVLAKTVQGNIYHFVNDWQGSEGRDESRFVSMLMGKMDTRLEYLICLWNTEDLTLEVPSWHLRTLLLGACPENRNTLLLLQGENHLNVRTLESVLPG